MDIRTDGFIQDRRQKLLERTVGRPYMYLSLTPGNVSGGAEAVDVANPAVIDLLRNPPNFREGGWGIYRTGPRSVDGGIVSEFEVSMLRDSQRLELLENGHLELSVKIEEKRFDIEYVRRDAHQKTPALYLYPMCEIPLNFLRLGNEVVKMYRTSGAVIINMGLYNIHGYSLCAYERNTEGYKRQWAEGFFPLWEADHLILAPVEVLAGFDPGKTTKKLSGELWHTFGFNEPPALFDEQGNFRP